MLSPRPRPPRARSPLSATSWRRTCSAVLALREQRIAISSLPLGEPQQEQGADVGLVGDQQQEDDGTRQGQQHGPHVPEHRFGERLNAGGGDLRGIRRTCREDTLGQSVELPARGLRCGAWGESADDVAAASVDQRSPVFDTPRVVEARRRHPHDGQRVPRVWVEQDVTEDGGVAGEAGLPGAVADDGDGLLRLGFLGGVVQTPPGRAGYRARRRSCHWTQAASRDNTRSPSRSVVVNAPWCASPAKAVITRLSRRSSARSATVRAMSVPPASMVRGTTIRVSPVTGRGRSRALRVSVSMAVVAPMPRPRIRTVVTVKEGVRCRLRVAAWSSRRACSSIDDLPRCSRLDAAGFSPPRVPVPR